MGECLRATCARRYVAAPALAMPLHRLRVAASNPSALSDLLDQPAMGPSHAAATVECADSGSEGWNIPASTSRYSLLSSLPAK